MTQLQSTNGLAKSTHQFIQTLILALILGVCGFVWHKIDNNSDRLITVEGRQQIVIKTLDRVEGVVNELQIREVRQDDRLQSLENNNKP